MENLDFDGLISRLPKTLYFSDVVPQDSGAGSSLIYRLLKFFPRDKLMVVNPPTAKLTSDLHLDLNVYGHLKNSVSRQVIDRLARSRFAVAGETLRWLDSYRTKSLGKLIKEFRPQVVVVVTHGCSWHTAVRYATSHRIPFFLIVHDDFKFTITMNDWSREKALQAFADAYRKASGVFCVSRPMAELYAARYQRIGTMLLPGRDCDNPVFLNRGNRTGGCSVPVIGYAGGLHNSGYRELVERCARIATGLGMAFYVFGPDRPSFKLEKPELLQYCGNFASSTLINMLNKTVDILFCPQSFSKEERPAMEINFPSKLTDYTAAGRPLLFWAPDYSSSIAWAKEAAGVACVVTQDDDDAMLTAIESLRNDDLRMQLAEAAIRHGAEYFAAERTFSKFASVLISGSHFNTNLGVSC